MSVILTSSSPAQRSRVHARFEKLLGADGLRVATNLTEAYHEAEHNPPKLAVFSEDLTLLPEFEVILALLRALHARVAVLSGTSSRARQSVAALHARSAITVCEDMEDDELRRLLGLAGPRAPARASAMPKPQTESSGSPGRVILIGSSTGGVEALIKVLSCFPPDCPPTFLVQHTGGGFSSGLARLLDSKAIPRVCEAENGMIVGPGTAVLAPGDRLHLQLRMRGSSATCRLVDEAPHGGHRPSVDKLFLSAVPHAPRIAAAILTGMGRDGATGLHALKKSGARTFGQDEATSLVYGMPKVAAEMGAVEKQLPIDQIGPALIAASSERTAA